MVDWDLTGVRALTEVPGALPLTDLGRTTRWARVQDIVENARLYLLPGSVQKSSHGTVVWNWACSFHESK